MAKRTTTKPVSPAPAASACTYDLKQIREIVGLMAENDLTYFHSEQKGSKLELRRGSDLNTVKELLQAMPVAAHAPAAAPAFMTAAPVSAPAAVAAPAASVAGEPVGPTINSPMVGTFYRSAAPGEKSFANIGDVVDENTNVCIIEAMKVMNEIKAEARGTIARVLVEDGKPVQYGQPLFELKA
ncbi:MAG: acetyl-CoA carboxylase biotin carboxyl carrier protein [Prosthecobacter sp.]|nr:acetyl-CoA carboxylase biotin carboxyl carrier protein [Prosthecobacter sp.]HBJ84052.1 acetyl-CoA carboxylase biotin carboxyl carrier protein [Verrucomicrobiales bacterium]